MVLLQLVCVLLREGSMFLVEIDDNQRVLALKDSIKKQKPDTITVEADQLQLFLAKGEDGNWLGDDTDLVRQLMRGEVPQGIQALTDGGEEIMPSKTIIHWLQKKNLPLPSCDQIHVLVYMPPKRRRLENVNKLADIPQINIQGVSYVTLPGELVAKCGLTPGGDLMLYCRPQVHKLWRFLRDDVIVKGIRGWILGPPGTGKSASLLSFAASLDPQEWNVVWIHLDEKGDLCVSMGSKQHWMVDDRSTFELPRVSSEKLFVCLDGYRKCDAHTALLRRFLVRFITEKDRLVLCSPMSARGKRDVESNTIARIEPFFMYSWTLDEYIEAVSDQTFYDKVAVMLDATYDWDVNGDGDDDDDEYTKTLSQEEQKLRLLHLKFYYAGGSCRFMWIV